MNQKIIAQKAGVSTATVSNVINGKLHKMSPETVAKVRRIIEEEGYSPNAVAQSLASSKSHIIGVVTPNLSPEDAFSVNPYNSYILSFLERYIRSRGYYMMLRCVGHCREIIPLFSSWNVDGVIILGPGKGEAEDIVRSYDVPMVFIDAYSDLPDIVNISIDDRRGGYLAGEYILERGHRRIAFVGPDVGQSGVVAERYGGFCDACRRYGLEPSQGDYYECYTIYDHAVAVGRRIAGAGYTAVVAASDLVAFGVMEGLRRAGLRVPEDVSVIGYDDLPECEISSPKLTSLSQNIPEKARLAGEKLFALMGLGETAALSAVEPVVVARASVRDIRAER